MRRLTRELDAAYLDLSDHVVRVSEWTESLRDLVTSVFETNLSLQDARLNNVMKKLSAWAAIIAVPTAITDTSARTSRTPATPSGPDSSAAPSASS